MNYTEEPIEEVLRKAPRPQPPPGLREQLLRGIPRPRSDRLIREVVRMTPGAWWRRWWPAVAGGSVVCACLAVVSVQQSEIRTLHAEIHRLKAEPTGVAQPANAMAAPVGSRTVAPPVAEVPLTDGPAELTRLRAAVSELNAEAMRLETMRTENAQLRNQAAAQAGLTAEETAALSEARAKAQRIACVNNLKQLGLAVRIWETDNGDVFPPDIISMKNEISSPKVLICPTDEGRQPAADWASYSAANVSYQYLAASAAATEPQRVMWVCPIHHNVTLCDGSVQQLSAERFAGLVQRDGKLYLGDPGPAAPIDPRTGMDRRMMERYGLLPPDGAAGAEAPGAQPQVRMDPELMKRYGLQPAPAPAPEAPAGGGTP